MLEIILVQGLLKLLNFLMDSVVTFYENQLTGQEKSVHVRMSGCPY